MDKSEVLTLVRESTQKNKYGVLETDTVSRDVFCSVSSVSSSEFFRGGQNGLNPQYQFKVFFGDYENEELCIFRGKKYKIYRTFEKDDDIELYAERRTGKE